MKTKGVIATGSLERWNSLYLFQDAGPTKMGPQLWSLKANPVNIIDNNPLGIDFFDKITGDNVLDHRIDFVYIIDMEQNMLHVLDGQYGWFISLSASIPMGDENEPNWTLIENMAP